MTLQETDPKVAELIKKEEERQKYVLNMIPSENKVSDDVREASASVLTNKYSEGYAGKRYYQGNKVVDEIELLAIARAKELFGAEHVNVQPLSGSPANFSVFLAFLEPGDTFLGFDLTAGGHLTHGSPVNFSGKIYNPVHYTVEKDTQLIDMENVRALAIEHKPKMIISGHSAYSRPLDFEEFQQIAEEVGAIHLADISHIAGLVAAGKHPSPFPYTDVVMTTTHKTLRGPRSAMLMCKEKYAKRLDKAVFPGSQGGPHNHIIAAKAVAFHEALQPAFKEYIAQVVDGARILGETLIARDYTVCTGGTENHLVLVDLQEKLGEAMGSRAAVALEGAGIICNANGVPFDPAPPYKPSGIRLGTPMLISQGFSSQDMEIVGNLIADVLDNISDEEIQVRTRNTVRELCSDRL